VASNGDIVAMQRHRAAIDAGEPASLLLWCHLLALRVRLITGNTRVVPLSLATSPTARFRRRASPLFVYDWWGQGPTVNHRGARLGVDLGGSSS
jgi:hypothetical protein